MNNSVPKSIIFRIEALLGYNLEVTTSQEENTELSKGLMHSIKKYINTFKLNLLLIVFSFCLGEGITQEYNFDIQEINIKDDLPHRTVLDIVQDKDGFIWISTIGAISRFDGKQFKTYDANFLGVSEGGNIGLAVDKDNHIWYTELIEVGKIGKGGILNHRQDTIYSFEDYTNGLFSNSEVLSIYKSSLNKAEWFVSTKQGVVYKYSHSFEAIFTFPDKINTSVFCDQAPNGDYWISHVGDVFQVRNKQIIQSLKTGTDIYYSKRFLPNPVFENSEYLKVYYELKNGNFLPYTLPNTEANQISSIIQFGGTFNFFTTNFFQSLVIQDTLGATLFDYRRPKENGPLSRFEYNCTFLDKQNIWWIGTGNGLFKIVQKKNPFHILLEKNSIRGIYQEEENQWIGGYQRSIFPETKLLGEKWETASKIPMTQFSKDEKGHLWIGTTGASLIQFSPERNEQIRYNFKDRIHLYCPFYNQTLNQLWIGTNNGLVYLDRDSKNLLPIKLPISSASIDVRQIYENDQGIWVISSKGLFLLSKTGQAIQHYNKFNKLPHDNLNFLYEDENGIFWLGTKGGGLIKWNRKDNTIEQFKQEDGLSNNVIYAVYEDDFHNLWLPSNYGIMAFDKNTYKTKVYLPHQGVAHQEFNTFSHFKAKDGTLYFGGINGITKFHPKDFQIQKNIDLPLYLTKLSVLGEGQEVFTDQIHKYEKTKKIELNADYQILELELCLLDYQSNEAIQYAYQIDGQQDNWIYTNDSKISMINIPYGNYTLNFKARGASGIWTNKPLSIPLQINAPFYYQTWFIIIMLGLVLVTAIGLIKWRERKFQKDRERLEREVKKRTVEIEASKATILEQSEALKELDKAKTRFFSNITHEFRTPLTLIIGPVQQLIAVSRETKIKQPLNGVLKNAQNILHLVNQLLDISKTEGGKMKLEISRGNIITYTKELLQEFKPLAERKEQKLVYLTKQKDWVIHFDKDKWSKIIYNLVSNAIKYTPSKGTIQLSLFGVEEQSSEWIYLRIRDTGIGIPDKEISHIFNRFYQVDDTTTRYQDGTGIGLALVKELIELQGGEVKVYSKVGKGTTFEIQLPVANHQNTNVKDHTVRQPVLTNSTTETLIDNNSLDNPSQNKEKLQLLLIEDNKEMLNYIYSCIEKEKYEVLFAMNGQEGIEKAQKYIPDLIISDVMMPIKDGFEVTQVIRSNTATSHIPIILLTAKAALESKLEGLKRGADAYLTKPFSPEELSLRIEKLIEIRKMLQQRYIHKQGNISLLTNKKQTKPFEKEDIFITRLNRFIESKIDDSSLNGQMLGHHLGISRMQLHRKIKALTNQSTSQYIQNRRFEMAVNLLKAKELTVSEIAYQLGFSSLHHFSRAFKQKYGKAPSTLQKS